MSKSKLLHLAGTGRRLKHEINSFAIRAAKVRARAHEFTRINMKNDGDQLSLSLALSLSRPLSLSFSSSTVHSIDERDLHPISGVE